MKALEERLAQVKTLGTGKHKDIEHGMCVMEATAYIAGEPWSDKPQCVCPVITTFMVTWNDSLPSDDERNRLLKPLIPLIVGTRSTPEIEKKRSYMVLDWLIRVYTPKWLDLVPALQEHAVALRGLDVIADMAGATAAGKNVDAAWDAAGAAAWDAARAALKPATEWLQASASDLVRAMAAVSPQEPQEVTV